MEQIKIKSEPQCVENTSECLISQEIKVEEFNSDVDHTSQKTVKLNLSYSLLEKFKSNPTQFHPGLKLYACGICSKLFETENNVMHHLTIIHRPLTLNILYGAYCNSCKRILEEKAYDKHLPCFAINSSIPIHSLHKTILDERLKENRIAVQCVIFNCLICGRKYISEEKLGEHLRLMHRPIAVNFHNNVNVIFCDTCQKLYSENTHEEHYPCCAVEFRCLFCLTTLPLKSHYRSHDLTWYGSMCYQCNLCSLDTRHYSVTQLNDHMATHNDLGVFKCVRCYNHHYPNADDLQYHILLFHNGCSCFQCICRCGEYDEEFYNSKILTRNRNRAALLTRNTNIVCEPEINLENMGYNIHYSNKQQCDEHSRENQNEEQNSSYSTDLQDMSQFLLSDIVKEEPDIFCEDSKPNVLECNSSQNNEESDEIIFISHNLEDSINLDQEDLVDPLEDPLNIFYENEANPTDCSDTYLKRGKGRPKKYNTKKRRLEWLRNGGQATTDIGRENNTTGIVVDQRYTTSYCDAYYTPKSSAERVREYRARKKMNEKNKTDSKTEAGHPRKYRPRKKSTNPQYLPNVTPTNLLLNQNVYMVSHNLLSQLDSTEELNYPGPSKTNNSVIDVQQIQNSSLLKNNNREHCDERRVVQANQMKSNYAYIKKRAKTAAERGREYRARKNANRIKRPPKSAAERNREYRARKKVLNATAIQEILSTDSLES